MRYLNIGCGSRYNLQWTNIDVVPVDESILSCDVSTGLSFESNYFDVVYHSHLVEHLERNIVRGFMNECNRVLKPGGIIRVVAPDLEQIVKTYLQCLQNAHEGKKGWDENYKWIMLEMYDQVVRKTSGGEMLKYLRQKNITNINFVLSRCGSEIESIIDTLKIDRQKVILNDKGNTTHLKKTSGKFKSYLNSFKVKEWLLKYFLGEEYNTYSSYRDQFALQKSGELHHWMYDRYSLSKLLLDSGFSNINIFDATKSNIENWDQQGLDTEKGGKTFKPDSIFIEGRKPFI